MAMRFSETTTVSGYPADEVVSALQKEIRRGNTESACFFTLELLESGARFEEKFWERMSVIVVEDLHEASLIPTIAALKRAYQELGESKIWDRQMQALKATQLLCEAKKDRITSETYDWLRIQRKEGLRIPIPPYAIDMHTKAGKEQGRGYTQFLQESATVTNERERKEERYREALKRYAQEGKRP